MKNAVIMAGGFGTRLRPLTMTIPKPMVNVMNVPMMEHIVNLLKDNDVRDIVSVLYFHPDTITSYFKDGSDFGIRMKYVKAVADYGTAGAVRNAYEYLTERFIIISGDVLTDFDIKKAEEFHIANKAKATILLTRVPKPLQYGIVMTDADGRINRFLEKPSWGQVFSDTINTGIYILEPEVLDLIPYQEEFDFSKDLFPLMLKKNMPLFGYIAEGYWRDVGNLEEYKQGQLDAIHGKIKLQTRGIKKGNIVIGENCNIAPTAKFNGFVVIDDNVTINDHAEITNSVIDKNVTIGAGSKIVGCTIWEDVSVGDFVEMTDDVICHKCVIGDSVKIEDNVYISENCNIGSHSQLNSNIKLWPNKNVEEGATLSQSLVQESKWARELFTDARISGISNIEMNPEFGAKLGAAIGMAFGTNVTLLASRDPDKVSRIMKRAITSGLASVGIHVNDLQSISIPQTRQELRTNKYAGGFHVRKSPRHPDKTDIIIFNSEGRDIPISRAKNVERFFFGEDIKHVHHDEVGLIIYPERTNEIYISRFLQCLNVEAIREKRFKILMDYSFGLAATIFASLLGKLNTETLSLHDYVDASRYQSDAHTERKEDFEAVKIMRSLGYELGFIVEPGAEKISLIDERGILYNPVRLLSIVTKLFLETNKHREPYKIAISIAGSMEIEEIAKDYNVEVVRIKDTHSAMMEATREENILFVGGVWGGYIFTEFLFASDGMYSIGKVLEMLATTKICISQLDDELVRRHQHQMFVQCPWEYKGTVMRKAMEYSEKYERQLIDGVKIIHEGDSVLLMPDREKAAFLVIGESADFEKAVILAKKYSALITQWQDDN